MSELKAIHFMTHFDGGYEAFYPKDEADKVITELKMKLASAQIVLRLNKPEALFSDLKIMGRLKHQIYVVERRERHQKYKRCLAMAEWCETRHFVIRYLQADKILNDENYIGTFDYIRREYMIKHYCMWANKWLALAEEPTWAKFLQLIHKERP